MPQRSLLILRSPAERSGAGRLEGRTARCATLFEMCASSKRESGDPGVEARARHLLLATGPTLRRSDLQMDVRRLPLGPGFRRDDECGEMTSRHAPDHRPRGIFVDCEFRHCAAADGLCSIPPASGRTASSAARHGRRDMDILESIALAVAVLGLVVVLFEAELRGHFRRTGQAWEAVRRSVHHALRMVRPDGIL